MNDEPPIIIGERLGWSTSLPFGISLADHRYHIYVIGKTGSGKTTLLRNLLVQHMRIPVLFGHRFRFDPDRIPVDVGQRSGVCRTVIRRHPDSNPGRSGQGSGLSGQRSGASGQFLPSP